MIGVGGVKRRIDQMDDKTLGKIVCALAIVGFLSGPTASLASSAVEGIKCLCRGSSFDYGIDLYSGEETVAKCDNDELDHCRCTINGKQVEVDIPHVDWLDEEDQEVDLICKSRPTRHKRSTETKETSTKGDSKEVVTTKTNVISRTINGAGSIVGGAGGLVSSGLEQVGSAAGSLVSGSFHIVGKVTRNITGFVGDSVKSVGNVFQSSKTERSKRSVEEPEDLEEDTVEENELDLDEEEIEPDEEVGDDDPGEDEKLNRSRRSISNDPDAEDTPASNSTNSKTKSEAISQLEGSAQMMSHMVDLMMRATVLLNEKDTVREVKEVLYEEYPGPQEKELIDAILAHITDEDMKRETSTLDVIKRTKVEDEEQGTTNRSLWGRVKHIRDHIKESDDIFTFSERLEGDTTLDAPEKAFSGRFKVALSDTIGCKDFNRGSKAMDSYSFADVKAYLVGRNKVCGSNPKVNAIISIIEEIPEPRTRNKRSAPTPSPTKAKKKKRPAKAKAKPAKATEAAGTRLKAAQATSEAPVAEEAIADEAEAPVDEGEEAAATCSCDPDTGSVLT